MDIYTIIGIVIAAVVGFGVLLYYLIKQTIRANADKEKMEFAGPVISRLSAKAKQKIRELGIGECPDYSTAGYEYFEYKTKYNYEDNMHLLMDDNTRQIVFYQLVPFNIDPKATYDDLQFFEVHNYSDLTKAETVNSLGPISSTGVGVGTGISVAGIPVGVGVSNTTTTQAVNMIGVTLYFSDGKTAYVNFLNNRSVTMGSGIYNQALLSANQLLAICEQIIKNNETPKTEGLNALIELQKLLDKQIITQEEFEAKKKQILNL